MGRAKGADISQLILYVLDSCPHKIVVNGKIHNRIRVSCVDTYVSTSVCVYHAVYV